MDNEDPNLLGPDAAVAEQAQRDKEAIAAAQPQPQPQAPTEEAQQAEAARQAAADRMQRVQRRPPQMPSLVSQAQAAPAPAAFDPAAFLREHEPKPFDPGAFIKEYEPAAKRSWSDVPLEAIKSVPSSAVEFGKNIVQPFIHPIETAQNLGALGGGVLQHLGLMKGDEYKDQASAVGKYLYDRYLTEEGIKEALATDPVGIAADLSMILTGGGSAAARLPGVAGKVGKVAATAGRLVDPLTPVIEGAAATGRGIGRLGAETAGITTHVGSEPFVQAAKAGYEGGPAAQAFRENITGRAPLAEPVADARQAIEGLKQKRGAAYRAGMAEVGLDQTVLDFTKIDQALNNISRTKTYKGISIDPATDAIRDKIEAAVSTWRSYPAKDYHTPEGFDALKQQIGSIRDATPYGTPERHVADQAYHAVRQSIIDQMGAVPGGQVYVKTMKGYEEASTQLRNIERELSTPSDKTKLNIDTSLRKLQSTLRNNVNTSFGRRQELAQFLVDNGAPHLMAKLAGQALHPLAPRGLGRLSLSIGSEMGGLMFGAGAISIPGAIGAAIPTAISASPRVMGEATYWGARGAGAANRAGKTVGKYIPRGTSYQAGRASNVVEGQNATPAGRADGGAVRPLGREGIKARNKARAVAARERSSLARRTAQAKRKVKFAEGGAVPYATDSPEFKEEVKRALATSPDAIAAKQDFYPRVPLNDKAWDSFIKDAPSSLNIEDRRPGYKGGLRAAHRLAGGGGVNVDSSEPDPLDAELARRNVPGGLNATAGSTVTSTTPVQDIPAPKVNSQGETLPTYALKEMGKGLISLPERVTKEAGDLQRRGEYGGSHEDLPGFQGPGEKPAALEVVQNLYGLNAPFAKPGLGIFGGKGAKTANLPKLAEAEQMLKEGVPHETIRNRTGWEFGSEGKPKFEISDAEARIKPAPIEDRVIGGDAASRDTGFRPNQRMEQQLEHAAAYEAYPWLKDMRTSIEVGEGIRPGASYAPPTKNQKRFGKAGEIEVRAPTYERGGVGDLFGKQYASDVGARDMLLHEMQHAIQEAEGFAPGSNPRQLPMTKADISTLTQNLAKREGVDWSALGPKDKEKLERITAHRIYKSQAGETEARNVQTRADDVLRQRPSWKTEDIDRRYQSIERTPKERKAAGGAPFKDAKIYKSEPEPEAPRIVGREAPAGGGRSSGIYKDPRVIAREAAELVTPEHPALKALFGVTREDLYGISQQGRRPGNLPDPAWTAMPEKSRGSAAAEGVMNPANEQRILDAMVEGGKHRGVLLSDAWYVMDPAYQRLEYLHGPELAKRLYDRLNTTGAMTSPASGVWDEIRRGTAANMMAHQGQFPLWRDWAGIAMRHRPQPGQPFMPVEGKGGTSPHVEHLAGQRFPPQLRQVPGHLAHKTAHAGPIEKYLERGVVEMGTPKVPTYIPASGVPETGFQTRWMVPDAHISKSLGMGDTRTQGTIRQGASMSMPEYRQIAPWYRERIAEPLGVEAVPAQARQWNLFGPQTGVRTMLGAPKLELLAQRIWERAMKEGWDPKVLRDQVLSGGAHAGLAAGIMAPALMGGLGEERPRE